MKKILAILLIIPVFMFSVPLAFPVSAAETTGEYFNVLDYVGVNGTASTSISLQGNSSVTFDLTEFFGSFAVYSYEIVFSSTYSGSSPLLSVLFDSNTSSFRGGFVTNDLYRYRGSFNGKSGSVFTLNFNFSDLETINFCSFNVYTVSSNSEPIGGQVSITGSSVSFGAGDSAFINGTYNSFLGGFSVSFENWRSYDFIDFSVLVSVEGITGVSSIFVSNVGEPFIYDVPLTVSKFENVSSDGQYVFLVGVRADLSNLDHVAPADSYLSVNFTVSPFSDSHSSSNYVRLYSANGLILQGQYNSSSRWYQVLFNNIRSGFMNLENSIMNFSDSVTDLFDTWFNSLFEKLDSYFNVDSDSEIDEAEDKLNQLEDDSEEDSMLIEGVDTSFNEIDIDVYLPTEANNDDLVQYYFQNFLQMFYVYDIVSFRFNVIIILAVFSYILFGKKL